MTYFLGALLPRLVAAPRFLGFPQMRPALGLDAVLVAAEGGGGHDVEGEGDVDQAHDLGFSKNNNKKRAEQVKPKHRNDREA